MHYILARERLRNALEMEHLELEKMYELDQMKSRFFANISHEFRTPITLILGPLERLISSKDDAGIIQKPLLLIYRNAQRLLRMSNQLMDFHKIEAEELKLELAKADIIQFIKGIVDSFSEQANHHDIKLNFEASIGSKKCWFDIDKIDKILYNLLSNAFKFTDDGGEITVRVLIKNQSTNNDSKMLTDLGDEYLQISIEDNGSGIAQDKIPFIFERFYRVNSTATPHQGSGIGLALTYELVKLYHGHISVKSEEGKGSQFTAKLPLDKYVLEEHLSTDNSNSTSPDKVVFAENHITDSVATSEISGAVPEVSEQTKSKTQTMLVVEDDKEMSAYLKDAFQAEFRVHVAGNGNDGLEKAVEYIPDIIISDVMMPEMDGIELCAKLKTNEKTSHIPIILLTVRSSDVQQIKGIKTGADAYITKPFNLEVLEARVSNLLESRKKLRERFSTDISLNPQNLEMTNVDEKFMQRLIEVVEENMLEPDFNAEALSKKIGMSRMQLYRKLRSLTNQTVHEFIRNLRLKRALALLEKKRVTITEVAYQVGFNDLTYFARCFRKRYGKLPSDYRAKKL
jgi:DNA-binding response OmpR family regulator/nitrogen-specific signal transduction histidine kinase